MRPAELFGLLGPNGSGKTTLFRILSTLMIPTAGRAIVLGCDAAEDPANLRRQIGVVFQAQSVDLKLTAYENLWHQGHLYGLRGSALKQRVSEMLQRVGLADRAKEQVGTFSGGMQRRIQLAKGLLHHPGVLLLDEPTTGLDPGARRDVANPKILFFVTGWLIVLMPFLFWWDPWFGRHLSDQQLTEYLHDAKKPRHIQHALVQLGDRMSHADAGARRWYPDLVLLAANSFEEVRNTDAWVMGQDTSGPGFHETLLKMLAVPSPMVRGNAALSLVRFGDVTGRPQIVALLEPAHIGAPAAGRVVDSDRPGTLIGEGGLIAKLSLTGSSQIVDVRSPIPGRIRSVAQTGANLAEGFEVAVVDPATEQVWEAFRALFVIGQLEILRDPAVRA